MVVWLGVVGPWQRATGWWWSRPATSDGVVPTVGSAREELLRILTAAAAGTPAVDTAAEAVVGVAAASAAARMRATRAVRTDAGASGALLQVETFIRANPGLAAGLVQVSHDVWDAVMEAFLTAKANPPTGHAWVRPPAWGPGGTPKGAGGTTDNAVQALRRLGYIGGGLVRVGVARRALGCTDREDTTHSPPVFAWRICDAMRTTVAASVWNQCARALIVTACLTAGRRGTASTLLLEQVTLTGRPTVMVVTPRLRQKPQHERATRRPRRSAQPIAVEHWMVRDVVVPWVLWLRSVGAVGTQYLFPSLVRRRTARAVTANGRLVGGDLWMEPMRTWSSRALAAALKEVVGAEGEWFHGLRSGNNIELRRHREPGVGKVDDVTRRTLHGRSVRDLIGSEDAYAEVFLEDLCAATRVLGGLRIERVANGLCTTGRSASAGEQNDWVACDAQVIPAVEVKEGMSGNDTSSGDDEEAEPGGLVFRGAVECGRCRRHLGRRDHGFMCDVPGCAWGVCPTCHPAGLLGKLLCPKHLQGGQQ
jgi:hypothetical protein